LKKVIFHWSASERSGVIETENEAATLGAMGADTDRKGGRYDKDPEAKSRNRSNTQARGER